MRPLALALALILAASCDLTEPDVPVAVRIRPGVVAHPADPPKSVTVRVWDQRGGRQELPLNKFWRARFLLTPGMYRIEVITRDIALECPPLYKEVHERFGTDSTRIYQTGPHDPHELRVTRDDDDNRIHDMHCEPYPYFTPPEQLTLMTLGRFEIEEDSVRISKGQLVQLHLTNRDPEIIRCFDIQGFWRNHGPSCDSLPTADSALLVTEDLRVKYSHVLPCLAREPGSSTGPGISVGITDCVQVTLITPDLGPGIERDPEAPGWGYRATGCGSSWLSMTKRDSGGTQWPEPFPSYDRLEVEIAC